jgi:hypothetical protein
MSRKMLRSVLVAAFSAAAAVGLTVGFSGEKSDVRADTSWPVVAAHTAVPNDTSWPVAPTQDNVRE